MEGLQTGKDCSRFGRFVQPEEPQQRSSCAARGYLGGRRPSGLAMYETPPPMVGSNNQHFQGFSHGGGSLHDEQALLSAAFEDMTLRTRAADPPIDRHNSAQINGQNSALINGHCLPGRGDFTFNPPGLSAYANQEAGGELAFRDYEQAYSFPPHYGNFSSSRQPVCDSNFSIPYRPSTASPSPFQQHCYVDGQPPMNAPYDQPIGPNFMLRQMGAQPYHVMQPHHAYPHAQRVSGLDAARNKRSNQQASVFTPPNGAPSYSYYGVPNFHGTEDGDYYLNGATLQKSNGWLNSTSVDRFPKNTDGAHGGGDFQQFWQPENDSLNLEWFKPQFLSKFPSGTDMESPQLTYNSVDEVVGRICTVAKDQNGCRFLQKVFTEGTQEDVEKVFAEIIEHICELVLDPFAHYLVQKIFDDCSDDQRLRIVCEITKVPADLLKICCNMNGTRVVQRVVESVNTPEEALKVVSALSTGAMRLMTDPNGCHVVYQCLQKFSPEHKAFLLDIAASRHLQLARDRNGCCVLQRCIEHSSDDRKTNLLNNITSSALRLSEDQYGNYVIQYILTLKIEWATARIVGELQGHFGNLSVQKCGSHVVEQCLRVAPQAFRDRILRELMNDPRLLRIMLDQYGNYVIQTALKESKGAQHTAFVEAIRPHIDILQSNMFGKKVLQRTYLKNKQYLTLSCSSNHFL